VKVASENENENEAGGNLVKFDAEVDPCPARETSGHARDSWVAFYLWVVN